MSKQSRDKWIVEQFPENYGEMTYVEPFGGTSCVLFGKKKSAVEVINDSDASVVRFYQALRDEPQEFVKRLKHCKFSKDCLKGLAESKDYLVQAVGEYVISNMHFSSKDLVSAKSAETWTNSLLRLPAMAARIRETFVFNRSALEVVKAFDAEETLCYLDPPYLHETRVSANVYISEMSTEEHMELSHVLNEYTGKVLISGYISPLYARLYKNWNVGKKKPCSGSREKKTEMCWKNF